jgi:HK97 family phage prohead protease
MLTKAIQLQLKDLDMGKREAVLAHATYKTLDKDGDRSNRGMFDKSWKDQFHLIRYFLNHDKKQAPGKALQAWDDEEHAYTRVKHGTHTLGEDVLKMMDEGVIMGVSFGFDPNRYKEIKGKGKDFLSVTHYETSALTHWGAHDSSHVVSVEKALDFPNLNLKALSEPEQGLLSRLIANGMNSIQDAIAVAMQLDTTSDLYTYIMYIISRQSDQLGDLRSQLRYGTKAAGELQTQVAKMQKFIRDTTASDEAIQLVNKSLNKLLDKNSDTVSAHSAIQKCPKCKTYSAGISDESGHIKCAECSHVIAGAPDASRRKDELRRKLLVLKAKMVLSD